MSRDARWLNIIWKHYRMKSIYSRKQVELFLDEEEDQFRKNLKKKRIKLRVMGTTHLHKEN